jgi:hypothetical protein
VTVSPSKFHRARRTLFARLVFACALAGLTPGLVHAAEQEPAPELSEKTSAQLEKLKPLLDAKNWDGALQVIQTALAAAKPDSYDQAFLADIEAKLYLQKGDYPKVIPPWELALRLGDQHHFFSENATQEMIYYMAQIYYQEATVAKTPVDVQRNYYGKATALLERWLAHTKKPPTDTARQDAAVFYASLLYNQATINPDKLDMDMLHRAEAAVKDGLRMVSRPKEGLYQLYLAISQQENNYLRLADILELLVKQHPQKKDYWSELSNVYLNLAGEAEKSHHDDESREYNIRAINAIERAQALGFMKTPKENYTLVGIYYNIGQFGRATELLHAGLRDGSIESQQNYWELLGSSYQQADRPYAAIDALKEGAKHFPNSGQLEYQAAQIYYSLNKPQDSYKALQAATSKGHLDKPGAVYGFLGYVAWELGKLPEAKAAVDKALETADGRKDQQLPILQKAIEEALRERDNANTAASKSA